VQKDVQNFDSKFTLPNDNHHVTVLNLSEGEANEIPKDFKSG